MTAHLHVFVRLRIGGSIPLLPLTSLINHKGLSCPEAQSVDTIEKRNAQTTTTTTILEKHQRFGQA
jgi:hypothetical protein